MKKNLSIILYSILLMIVICFINGTEVKAETSEDGRYGYQIFDDETKEIEITYYYGSEEEVGPMSRFSAS